MKTFNALFIIMGIMVILLSATIANCKFTSWKNYQISSMSKSYLDLLEEETGNLDTAGQKALMQKAFNK